jgi:hypothetical protein
MRWIWLGLVGCGPSIDERVPARPIATQLVVHVDPLIRGLPQDCESDDLVHCGGLQGSAFVRRSRNLEWLSDCWKAESRTLNVQVGPDMALAWAGDSDVMADLAEEVDLQQVSDASQRALKALQSLNNAGLLSVGVHAHAQMQDGSGRWGDLDVAATLDPCGDVSEPVGVERATSEAANGVTKLADVLGMDLVSFGSQLPRSVAGKVTAVEDPQALDTGVYSDFPPEYQPKILGAGLSECFVHEFDHPIFEAYPSSDLGPLEVGDGPMVVPGTRVVGSMAAHLGVGQDGSVGASQRRFVQQLIQWRHSALKGEADRPWAFTFHTHLFDLMAGTPEKQNPSDRDSDAVAGQKFRGDLDQVAAFLDTWSRASGFTDVRSTGTGVVEWVTAEAFAEMGPGPDSPTSYEEYPYLPVLQQLEHSHLACTASTHGVWIAGFERCTAGWSWGRGEGGYTCSDDAEPDWLTVLIPASEGCQPIPKAGSTGWVLDAENPADGPFLIEEPLECWGDLFVPSAGLLVIAESDSLLPSFCMNG